MCLVGPPGAGGLSRFLVGVGGVLGFRVWGLGFGVDSQKSQASPKSRTPNHRHLLKP